jgi:aspartate/tyrosine/aromatic aminotransferase
MVFVQLISQHQHGVRIFINFLFDFFVVVVGNHDLILKTVGFEVRKYRYWNKEKLNLDIDGLIADLEAAPEKSVILLHACAVRILQLLSEFQL